MFYINSIDKNIILYYNKLKKEKIRMDKKAKRKGIDPNKKDRTKHQGKFSAKYSERIQSIKDSDKERPKKIEK